MSTTSKPARAVRLSESSAGTLRGGATPPVTGHQVMLHACALHPELFALRGRRVVRQGFYEVEAWVMPGAHMLRFEHGRMCASELVAERDPASGKNVLMAFPCAGERDAEYSFGGDRVTYMTTIQTETLSENLYLSTYDEMRDFASEAEALVHEWRDGVGRCLSIIEIEPRAREMHAQCYHLIAKGGLVIRTATIFEMQG